ncbi:hypothetical protein WJX84_002441 [Apatococcus fuscideae]|uniref:Uncharacterized protein n=1 Tax=Apatococcus fuscideae TaxID=2026836 RepID=A0AAW1T6K8_9CHLO
MVARRDCIPLVCKAWATIVANSPLYWSTLGFYIFNKRPRDHFNVMQWLAKRGRVAFDLPVSAGLAQAAYSRAI